MSKRPKQRVKENTNALLESIKFVGSITNSVGSPQETNILLSENYCVSFNGILACGTHIDTNFVAFPNCELLIKALSKCNEQYAITQLENGLSIKSDKFRAIVPCLQPNLATPVKPDAAVATLDNRFREALSAVSVLATEGAQRVYLASVLMAGSSLVSTTGTVIFEFWHGTSLPTGIALPKSFALALQKISKNIAQFGYSKNSVTIYFEDQSWIKSQIFAEPWPDVGRFLNGKSNLWPLPNGFYEAIDAIAPFSENGDIYFSKDMLRSHADENKGATYECSGIPNGPVFNARQLKIIQPYVKQIDFDGLNGMLMWVGETTRGAIAGRSK